MTYLSIIKKEIRHNFNKYFMYLFVNISSIALIYIYTSFVYNSGLDQTEFVVQVMLAYFKLGLIVLSVFSLCFISYTNISTLKTRSKDFGTYLTLGMTTKDLQKYLLVENLIIMLVSIILGLFFGLLLSNFFYLGVNNLDIGVIVEFEVNLKAFLLATAIYILITLLNNIYTAIYLKRNTILSLIKAKSQAQIGTANKFIGFISLILFISALYFIPDILFGDLAKELSGDTKEKLMYLFSSILLITPYFIIGNLLIVVRELFKLSPKLYNNNILPLSSLSHKFLGYRNLLFLLTILTTLSLGFIGLSYIEYTLTEDGAKNETPFDISFVESDNINNINEDKMLASLESDGAVVDEYYTYDFLNVPIFTIYNGKYKLKTTQHMVISESTYNYLFDEKLDLSTDKCTQLSISEYSTEIYTDPSIFVGLNEEELNTITTEYSDGVDAETFNSFTNNHYTMTYETEDINSISDAHFANMGSIEDKYINIATVVDDNVYNELTNFYSNSMYTFNLINYSGDVKTFDNFQAYMGSINQGLTPELQEEYAPIIYQLKLDEAIGENSMMLFTVLFIGILFIFATAVILYYKIMIDSISEGEQVKLLKLIGVTNKEIKRNVTKELVVFFYAPLSIAIFLCMYFVLTFANQFGDEIKTILLTKGFEILAITLIFNTIFFVISRRKYFRNIKVA